MSDKTESLHGTAALTAAEAIEKRPSRPSFSEFQLDGFRLGTVLGRGGMGIVYEAEQLEPRRRVAIKVLHLDSATAFLRFKTEANIMARLDHPGIARVLQSGESGGLPYLVMEFVDGEPFDEFVKPLDTRQRIALFVQLCDAVHHAHVKGVIHRDLKPSNIMVRPPDRVIVLDFGIARLEDDDGSTPARTVAGEILGTPIYMSPEQAKLRPDEVDARSDVYTLGVILFELLVGKFPYNVRSLPINEVARVIVQDPVTPLGSLDPELGGDVQAIVNKALEKRPDDRYQSVALLAEDLRRYLAGQAVSVRNPGPVERFARFVRRRPWVTAGIAGTLLALTAFGAVVTTLWLDARAAHHAEERAHARAEQAHVRVEAARVELETRNNQLILRQARAALERDPTESLAWLATLTDRDVDAGTAWAIADEALARGVAHAVIRAHSDQVHRVEPLPSGAGFVTAGYDSRAIVWNGSLTAQATIVAKRGRVHVARPSPNGSLLAIGGDDGELFVASPDGKLVGELPGHAGSVQDVAWSPDGAWLATGDEKGNLFVWPRGAAPGTRLSTAKTGIAALTFSTTSKLLIAGDAAGALWVHDLGGTASRSATLAGELVGAWSDDTRLVTVDGSGAVREFRITPTALVPGRSTATGVTLRRAAFARDGGWVVVGALGGALLRVEGTRVEPLTTFRAQVRTVAVSSDQRWIAAGTDDGALEIRDTTSGRVIALHGHRGRVRHVAFTTDARALLSADSEGVVRIWELGKQENPILTGNGLALSALAAAADGTQIAAIDAARTVWLWTLTSMSRRAVGTAEGRVTQLAVRDDLVVTATAEGELRWWGAASASASIGGVVRSLAMSQRHVAIATAAGPIVMFARDGTRAASLAGHAGGSDAVAFSATGRLLASGGQDRKIRTWQVQDDGSYKADAELDGDLRGDTRFIAWSPRGDLLVAAGNDGIVHAWTVRDGKVDAATHRVLARHTGAVTALAFDETGELVASGGRDATVTRVIVDNTASAASAKLSNAPVALMFDASDDLHAVTYAGAEERWTPGQPAVTEIDHGLYSGLALRNGRWLLAFEDGTLLVSSRSTRPLAELTALLARTTTYQLPPR